MAGTMRQSPAARVRRGHSRYAQKLDTSPVQWRWDFRLGGEGFLATEAVRRRA